MRQLEEEALARWACQLETPTRHVDLEKLCRGNFPLLLGQAHPTVPPERLGAALDFLIWNFSWNDQMGEVPPVWLQEQSWLALAVLQGATPARDAPPSLWLLRDIRERLLGSMPRARRERFIQSCQSYFRGTIREARVRAERLCLDVSSYVELRRLSAGTSLVFTQMEALEGFFLPEDILAHPTLVQLMYTATDVMAWANDLFSLERDLRDEFHPNLVLSLRLERTLSLDRAVHAAAEMHDTAVRRFLVQERALPSFGAHDAAVSRLVLGLRRWIRANLDWSRVTGRYPRTAASQCSRVA
ncbi:terpene synthase family protein [Cystobacter fuscus]